MNKRSDEQLARLFRAATQPFTAQDEATPPFGMEARVLAAWREAAQVPVRFWETPLLVRGLIVAAVLAVLSLWPAVQSDSGSPASDYAQVADSTVQVDGTSP